ncbi:MAG: GNAT family N-acetyltransferase [Nanoarchaeota archaeon]|nr:GNAT family N-acetyltransferase [Nanoarchaeota archaeon]
MQIKTITNITQCKKLWKEFSPKKNIWGLWDIVYSFYNRRIHKPLFLILEDDKGKIEGLLPLWFDKEGGWYTLFGGSYPENRRLWFDIKHFKLFLEKLPTPLVLYDINNKQSEDIIKKYPELEPMFTETDYRYFINLKEVDHSFEKYVSRFNKKHRKNLRNDLKKIEQTGYKIVWETTEHIKDMIRLNIERFGEESDFKDKTILKEMKNFIKILNKKKMLFTSTVIIDNKTECVEIAAFYNKKYYVINGGYNKNIPNLGKLIVSEHIKKAIELKADEIDFLIGDSGWKKLWKFDKEQCYTFEKEK